MNKICRKEHPAKKWKRHLALFLSICLIGTMTPITARAETGGTEDTGYEQEATCTCSELCTEDHLNSDCPVCGKDGADLNQCKGKEQTKSEEKQMESEDKQTKSEEEQTESEVNDEIKGETARIITTWQWIDEEEYLDEETGSLSLPGANKQTPAYFDDVTAFLPTQIQATVVNADDSENPETGVEETISLGDWECDNYPVDGAYSGSYTFTAALPEGYTLSEEAKALTVLVELGGAQMWSANGSWGNGLSWTLNDEGTLTFEGYGDIPDGYQSWGDQATSVKEIVIGECVTGIGKDAFLDCESLTTVSFADERVSTLSIGDFAFCSCTALESIVIPNYVTTLGSSII